MSEQQIPTSKVLNGGADHIRQYGHHKGSGHALDGGSVFASPACTIGALTIASWVGRTRMDFEAHEAAIAAVQEYLGTSVVMWNDHPDRTAAEVIETLRAAAVIEAAREQAPATNTPKAAVR